MSLEDAITNIRGNLVRLMTGLFTMPFQTGYTRVTVDKLRSLVAMYKLRAIVSYWKERGDDFSAYVYVPQVDPTAEGERHDRGDHNQLFRRMAKSV